MNFTAFPFADKEDAERAVDELTDRGLVAVPCHTPRYAYCVGVDGRVAREVRGMGFSPSSSKKVERGYGR